MKKVFWEKIDKEKKGSESSVYLFINNVFNEFTPLEDYKKVAFIIESSNLTLQTKNYIDYLIKGILDKIKYESFIVLLSDKSELINEETFENNGKVIVSSISGFEEAKKKREFKRMQDYRKIKPFLISKHYIPESIVNADTLIIVNVFDTSSIFQIKGTVSSLFYFLPTYVKSEILIKNNEIDRSKAMLEIFSEIKEKITLAFNIVSDEEDFIVVSDDPISVDAFTSALSGIKALSIPLTKVAHKEKIGMGDIIKIRLLGDKFTKPVLFLKRKYYNQLISINTDKCDLCMKCVDVCPLSAIFLENDILHINHSLCNKCFYCLEICPLKVIN